MPIHDTYSWGHFTLEHEPETVENFLNRVQKSSFIPDEDTLERWARRSLGDEVYERNKETISLAIFSERLL